MPASGESRVGRVRTREPIGQDDGTDAAPPRLLRFDPKDAAMTVAALSPRHLPWFATDATVFASRKRVLFVSREGVSGGERKDDLRGLVALTKPPPPDGWWPFW